jgi:integrase
VERNLSAATQQQALGALLFLYRNVLGRSLEALGRLPRGRVPTTLPVVLTPEELARVLGLLRGTHRLVGLLLYGSGLRVTECLMLRVNDLDLDRGELTVRRGKGGKDRVTVIPEAVQGPLREHLGRVKALHGCDLAKGGGWVEMPGGLDAKYPNAGSSWPWQWVFPARRSYRDSESGRVRRHHLHALLAPPVTRGSLAVATLAGRVCADAPRAFLVPRQGGDHRRPTRVRHHLH